MENTFKIDVGFQSLEFDETAGKMLPKQISKTLTFEELDRANKKQHKLHFMLMSLPKEIGETSFQVDTDTLYDLTVKFIEVALLVDTADTPADKKVGFTETEKKELLQDSFGLLQLGLKLSAEKFTPFFFQLMTSFKK